MKISSRSIKVAQLIRDRVEFETYGSLYAERGRGCPTGRLPAKWQAKLWNVTEHSDAYVVYSYSTPIAWHTDADGWAIPSVKYSPTTSKHQGKLYLVASVAVS